MNRLSAFSLAALMGLAVAAGCSSGGANKIDPIPAQPQSLAQFVISVPTGSTPSSSTRKPQFAVPGGTQSVTIQLTSANGAPQSGQSVVVNLSASNNACSAVSGTLTCTVTVPGVTGADVFLVTAYSQANGQGSVIAKGNAAVTTAAGQTTTVPITLNGVVASVAISFGALAVNGISATVPVMVNVKDASGSTIMGTYDKAVTLANSDTSGVTKLSATTVNDSISAAAVTLSYTGGALANGAVISATANGISSANITNATFNPNGDYATNNGLTLTYSATQTSGTGRTYTWGYTNTYSTGVTYNGQSNLLKVHYAPTGSGSYVDDYYYQFVPIGVSGGSMNEIAWTDGPAAAQTSSCSDVTNTSSPWLIAELPFKAQNAWDASGSYVDKTTCVNGTATTSTETYAYNKDGSYDDQYTNTASTYSYHDILNSDGSGSTTWTDNAGATTTTYGTPQPAPTGVNQGNVIAETTTFVPASPNPSASPTPAPAPTYVPDWIPGGTVPSPLQSDKTVDKGSVTIPTGCNVASSIATTAEQLEETYSDIDTLYGWIYNSTNDFYFAPNVGLVCATYHSTNTRYNMTLGTVRNTSTWSETDTLTSVSTSAPLSTARSAQSVPMSAMVGPASYAAAISQALRVHQQLMQQRHAAARAEMVKTHLRHV